MELRNEQSLPIRVVNLRNIMMNLKCKQKTMYRIINVCKTTHIITVAVIRRYPCANKGIYKKWCAGEWKEHVKCTERSDTYENPGR